MFGYAPRLCQLCCRATLHRTCTTRPLSHHGSLSSVTAMSLNIQRRNLCLSHAWRSEKKEDYEDMSQDPLIKEWMRDIQRDFEREGTRIEDGACGARGDEKERKVKGDEGERDETGRDEETRADVADINCSDTLNEIKSQESLKLPMKAWAQFTSQKYETFDSHATQVIYDYDEERLRREEGIDREEEKEEEERREMVQLKRGERGVFDVEELVELLRDENGKDIVVIQVPASVRYVEHLVIVTSRSQRHSNALGQLVRRAYLAKKTPRDFPLLLEGRGSNWIALDMRNIALHIMDCNTREIYDLETLWTVGSEFDEKSQPEEDLSSVYSCVDPLAGLGAAAVSLERQE